MTLVDIYNEVFAKQEQLFQAKEHDNSLPEEDVLMKRFEITSLDKLTNKQYYNRELGKVFETLCKKTFRHKHNDRCKDAPIVKKKGGRTYEPFDLIFDNYAIDFKYRLGSGDSGTLNRLRKSVLWALEKGYEPVYLILREDNLDPVLKALQRLGARIIQGEDTFRFIEEESGVNLREYI